MSLFFKVKCDGGCGAILEDDHVTVFETTTNDWRHKAHYCVECAVTEFGKRLLQKHNNGPGVVIVAFSGVPYQPEAVK